MLGVCFWPFSTPGDFSLCGRLVPEAEVNLEFLKVGFGDVGYQGVNVSGAEHIGRGADTQLIWARKSPHYI
jgi:hypothetical protein